MGSYFEEESPPSEDTRRRWAKEDSRARWLLRSVALGSFMIWGFWMTLGKYHHDPGLAAAQTVGTILCFSLIVLWPVTGDPASGPPSLRQSYLYRRRGPILAGVALLFSVESAYELFRAVLARPDDIAGVVEDLIRSGRLGVYLTAFQFAVRVVRKGLRNEVPDYAIAQWVIFLMALGALLQGYLLGEPGFVLAVLSWAIFFVFNDWGLIEDYLPRAGLHLAPSHFLRISLANLLMLGACGWRAAIKTDGWWLMLLPAALLLGFWMWSVVWLYRFTRTSLPFSMNVYLDRLLGIRNKNRMDKP